MLKLFSSARLSARLLPAFLLVMAPAATAQVDDKQIFNATILEAGWDAIDNPYSMAWEGQGWIGSDMHKFWWKTQGEVHRGTVEDAELQFLYSRPIHRFFDAQAGIRYDMVPRGVTYAVLGVQGLAPYWFEVGGAIFIDHNGKFSARLEAEYDLLITQKLILRPFVEANFSASTIERRGVGYGLVDVETGLQLRYEVKREFAPYIEFRYSRLIGQTARLARAEGESRQDFSLLLGIRVSF